MAKVVIDVDRTKRYFNDDGRLHREDGASLIHSNGTKYWHDDGKIHCSFNPAIERKNGQKEWWDNNLRKGIHDIVIDFPNGFKMHGVVNGRATWPKL